MHVADYRTHIACLLALLVVLSADQARAATLGDQLFKLTANDGAMDDRFGTSVATSGNLAIVGAPRHDGAGMDAGAAYLFDVRTGQQLMKFTADDAAADDGFGISVDISGNLAIVGASGDDDVASNSGSAYVFDVTTGTQLWKLNASDPAEFDTFGASVAVDGNNAIVGAPLKGDPNSFIFTGAAYSFDLTTGMQDAKLTASDPDPFQHTFGQSVGLSGNVAVVGGPRRSLRVGSAYLFDPANGDELFPLYPEVFGIDQSFGESVDIDGDLTIVGAWGPVRKGNAQLFDTTTGNRLLTLVPLDPQVGFANGDGFGRSVAINQPIAIVGAPAHDNVDENSGAAYLFDAATGTQLFKLIANDAAEDDFFGSAVDIGPNTVIVGASLNDDDGDDSGAAYIFATVPEPSTAILLALGGALLVLWTKWGGKMGLRKRSAARCLLLVSVIGSMAMLGARQAHAVMLGDELFKLTANDGAAGDRFGESVATSGNFAIVGAPRHDSAGMDAGAAYLFDIRTGQQLMKFTADDAAAEDAFGHSVDISGNLAIIGAWGDDDTDLSSGAAYIFDISTGNQLLKLTADDAALADGLGYSVAIDGDKAVAGAPFQGDLSSFLFIGAAYSFDLTTGDQEAKFTATNPGPTSNAVGWSVGISGDVAVVGGPRRLLNIGSAYLFDATSGDELFELLPPTPFNTDQQFGQSVGIDGNRAIVGMPDIFGFGSAHLFDATNGDRLLELKSLDGQTGGSVNGAPPQVIGGDKFGWSVAINQPLAIVGAQAHDNIGIGEFSGAAYLFDSLSGLQLAKLIASDAAESDSFGDSVDIGPNTVIVGATGNDEVGEDAGAAYIFATVPEPSTMALLSALVLIFFRVARIRRALAS